MRLRGTGLLLCIGLLVACSSQPKALTPTTSTSPLLSDEIFVVSHGWHTGLVLPASLIHAKLPALQQRFPKTPYIELGWGDKGFYQAQEITTGLTLRAIFWPTESVVHAVAVPTNVARYFPQSEVLKLCLTQEEMESLLTFVASSFALDNKGLPQAQKKGLYGNSQFYRGVGDYYLMNTCNKWTAKALQSAGLKGSALFKLTAGSVMSLVEAQIEQNQAEGRNQCRVR